MPLNKDWPNRTVIITGGAGFLGRCAAEVFIEAGFSPILLDNFSTGHRSAVKDLPHVEVDLSSPDAMDRLRATLPPAVAVIHFAAFALVAESVQKPGMYFRNNILSTVTAAELAAELSIPNLVHSSSCAVYGIPKEVPISEKFPLQPISPYGETKRLGESILNVYAELKGTRVAHLRYFNPIGAYRGHGERHVPETHLVPNVVAQIVKGASVSVFGTDYPTPDGSAIRDYIHVADLAQAHVEALKHLSQQAEGFHTAINVGTGQGSSVLQIVKTAEKLIGKQARIERLPRRPGDPAELVADTTLSRSVLKWAPKRSLEEALQDHLEFAHPNR